MTNVRSFVPALGAAFLLTLSGTKDKITFSPEAGATVQKSFKVGGEFTLQSLNVSVDGNDMSGMIGNVEVDVKQNTHIDTTDVYKAVADGRPKDLLRTFDSIGGKLEVHVKPEGEVPEVNTASALEGKTVAFHWNADKSEYERSFYKGEGKDKEKSTDADASTLEHLQEDMDLRALLPSSEVAENDSWKVELKSLLPVASPGGDLCMAPEGMPDNKANMDMFKEMFADFGKQVEDMLEGECTCTYKGMHEEKGLHLAEIAIEVNVNTTLDLSDLLQKVIHAALEQSGVNEKIDFSLDKTDLNFDFDGTGTLLWNMKAGRAESFQLGGEMTIGLDLSVSIEAQGESHSVDASLEMQGSMHHELETKE